MEKLPLIPVDYPLFSWSTSTGAATAEQLQAAYQAALNQGQCADFSRFVWNDMVDLLNTALVTAGLGWDDSYTTKDNTKISARYGALTANRFNSMRLNIDRVAALGWKWANDPQTKGYLGREVVRGVAGYGERADTVYGWYMIELARRLNVALEILRNTADFAEFAAPVVIENHIQAEARACRSAPAYVSQEICFPYEAPGVALPAAHLGIAAKMQVHSNPAASAHPSRPLQVKHKMRTTQAAQAKAIPTQPLSAGTQIHTVQAAALSSSPSSSLKTAARITTKTHADLAFDGTSEMVTQTKIALGARAAAAVDPALAIDGAQALMHTYSQAALLARQTLPVLASAKTETRSLAQLKNAPPLPLGAAARSFTGVSGGLELGEPLALGTEFRVETHSAASLVPGVPMALGAQAKVATKERAVLVPGEPLPLLSGVKLQTKEAASVCLAPPLPITVGTRVDTAATAQASALPAVPAQTEAALQTQYTAALSTPMGAPAGASARVQSRSLASLVAEPGPNFGWTKPVQTGNHLYIRQAFDAWQQDTNLAMDQYIYYPPEQEGSNLHIISYVEGNGGIYA